MKTFFHNLYQLLVCIDQLINVLIGLLFNNKAWADETMSACAYRYEIENNRTWARKLIDTLFFFQHEHCKTSYESEVHQRQMPPSTRD